MELQKAEEVDIMITKQMVQLANTDFQVVYRRPKKKRDNFKLISVIILAMIIASAYFVWHQGSKPPEKDKQILQTFSSQNQPSQNKETKDVQKTHKNPGNPQYQILVINKEEHNKKIIQKEQKNKQQREQVGKQNQKAEYTQVEKNEKNVAIEKQHNQPSNNYNENTQKIKLAETEQQKVKIIESEKSETAKPTEKTQTKPAEKTQTKQQDKTQNKPTEKTQAKQAEKTQVKPAEKAQTRAKPIDQSKYRTSTISQQALKEFHPLELSTEAKEALLNKYKRIPKVNPQQRNFMPIVQDRDQEILPILKDFQKFNEVVHYSSINMSDNEWKGHEVWFNKKLQERHSRNQRKLRQQGGYAINPDATLNAKEFKITRGQWYSAFEYHTLVGVNISTNAAAQKIAEKEVQYFEKKYDMGKQKKELGMCIISPGLNNEAFDRYLWNIESVLQQNYTNYRMIIIDDASTDKTVELLAKHMRWRNLSEDKFVLIKNKKSQKATANIFYATHKYCRFGEIQVTLDSDDQLLGRQVLKVLNTNYQKHKYLTLYSSLIFSVGNPLAPYHILGKSKDNLESDVQIHNFRRSKSRGYSALRTMLSDLFLLMKPQTLKDWKNTFYLTVYDNAIYYTAMEMSCGKIKYLPQLFYYYNSNTGINDDAIRMQSNKNREEYAKILKHIDEQKSYRCIAQQFLWINDYQL